MAPGLTGMRRSCATGWMVGDTCRHGAARQAVAHDPGVLRRIRISDRDEVCLFVRDFVGAAPCISSSEDTIWTCTEVGRHLVLVNRPGYTESCKLPFLKLWQGGLMVTASGLSHTLVVWPDPTENTNSWLSELLSTSFTAIYALHAWPSSFRVCFPMGSLQLLPIAAVGRVSAALSACAANGPLTAPAARMHRCGQRLAATTADPAACSIAHAPLLLPPLVAAAGDSRTVAHLVLFVLRADGLDSGITDAAAALADNMLAAAHQRAS